MGMPNSVPTMSKHCLAVSQPLLKTQCVLGEACVWDSNTQRLYFIDIEGRRVYTFQPSTGVHGFEQFDSRISAITLRKGLPGLIATTEYTFELIPASSLPFPPTSRTASQMPTINLTPDLKGLLRKGTNRFNEGACDPMGRFLAGTMGCKIGDVYGTMYSLEKTLTGSEKFTPKVVLNDVTCTNGMGWTKDGKVMYFTDSWIATIFRFDYRVTTGEITNRQVFSDLDASQWGYPDGLCMDANDHVWSARWQGGKVIRLTPQGKVDIVIDFPFAWNMTCCIFGGTDMTDLYVTSASSELSGDDPKGKPQGGDLFIVKGLGVKGVERYRCSF